MANERLPRRKTKEILRLRWAQGLTVRETVDNLMGSNDRVRYQKQGAFWLPLASVT